ncbi:HNH endonuclease [Sinomonas atrocyanea]
MFESAAMPVTVGGAQDAADLSRLIAEVLVAVGSGSPSAAAIGVWATALGSVGDDDLQLDEAELLERIAAQERLKAAAAASQARYSVLLETRIRERRAGGDEAASSSVESGDTTGTRPRVVDPSTEAGQAIALARCESPSRGGRLLGLAKALVHEMPHTLNALAAGRINEWRATLVARETACLDVGDRARVDEALVPAYARGGVGDRQLAAEARAHAQRLDPAAAVKRARRAVTERRVWLKPAPDSMAVLSCLLPAAQAVAAYKALCAAADSARVCRAEAPGRGPRAPQGGDGRTRDQTMADTLVERLTGQGRAGDVRIAVNVVMSDAALVGGSPEPAALAGYGVLPAQIARDLVLASSDAALRRLYTSPTTGSVAALESRCRAFPPGLRDFIALRDQTCRNPWCDAPIRHHDHVVPAARGGPTSAANGQGLCERCNQAKEAPGWRHATTPALRHTVTVTTPAGHRYRSTAPPLPGVREVIGHRVEFPGGECVFHTAA